jgi:hypothetical protein
MSTDKAITQAQRATALSINHVMTSANVNELTQLEIDELTELAEDIGRVLPAGNVVKMVFSQLRAAQGRRLAQGDSKRMMSLLQQGMATMLGKASYMAFYSTPALLISGYQMLLRAAGRDPDDAFPHGVWQFYLEFGLREDAARHACETIGFQQNLSLLRADLSDGDQLAANILAVGDLLEIYDQLLTAEWRERLLLTRMGDALNDTRMVHQWLARRPYDVPRTSSEQRYIHYRQAIFNKFVRERLGDEWQDRDVDKTIHAWGEQETLADDERRAYQEQMSVLARLQPSTYNDERQLLAPTECSIGVIWRGQYYLVPFMHGDKRLPEQVTRGMAHAIVNNGTPPEGPQADNWLTVIPRASQPNARESLPRPLQAELEMLRSAPIILNWDMADASLPLSKIRQGQRGIGDHPLTIFRTPYSLVFDQSHIFFDATLGMAIAEIYTNFASRHLRSITQPTVPTGANLQPRQVNLSISKDTATRLGKYYKPTSEVAVETTTPIVSDMNRVRHLFKQRNDELRVTINDLLLLYRSLHNQVYKPSEALQQHIQHFATQGGAQKKLAATAQAMLEDIPRSIPAILIPIDASAYNPSARLFPITFCPRSPWTEFHAQHRRVWELLQEYQELPVPAQWDTFSEARLHYLQMVRMFGMLMQRYKEIALDGKSFSTVTLQMLAGVPRSLQGVLRDIPDRIDILNDMLKGTEVFSNVGRVADTSTLWRFTTAKDDNHKKELCWGIMTRADNTMVISLRDFRPVVQELLKADAGDLAHHITDDFLNSYARGLEQFIWQLAEITRTRRRRQR